VNKTSPFLLLILGLLVGYPAARLATAPPAEKAEASAEAPKPAAAVAGGPASLESEDCKPAGKPEEKQASGVEKQAPALGNGGEPQIPPYPWCMPLRALREFFGLSAGREKPRGESLGEVISRAKAADYDLRFLVALVPAPPDPRLDQALDAIQRGFVGSKYSPDAPAPGPPQPDGYLLDRVWFPWAATAASQGSGLPEAPGIMLFRGDNPHSLAVVFLVPETSKMGIQKDTFRVALDLVADLQEVSIEPKVSILGPSFSGSVESLRLALVSWRQSRNEGADPLRFQAASGSATADGLESVFDGIQVGFCRAVLPDSVLHARALAFLQRQMGWNPRRIGLLTEDDTGYGQGFVDAEKKGRNEERQTKGGKPAAADPRGRLVLLTFPSHISDLRNAWEDEQKAEKAAAADSALPPARRALDLDLAGSEQEGDLVPTFSSTTTLSSDLTLSNLLQTIAREGIRYVGIVATDTKDKLFLAEKLRQLAPDVVLFTFDNNLLYAHPEYAEAMDGMLVFSSYPLFTEGAPGFPSLGDGGASSDRRQFSSEYQQGVFEAVRSLVGGSSLPPPQGWIAAVGNGSLWPIARLPLGPGSLASARFCGGLPGAVENDPRDGFDGKDDLQILLVAAVLCLLAVGLKRVALLEEITADGPGEGDPGGVALAESLPLNDVKGNRRLLVAGISLLAAATGVLLAVAASPLWSNPYALLQRFLAHPAPWAYLLVLAAMYAFLVREVARAAGGGRPRPATGWAWASSWTAGGVLALVLLVLAVFRLCVPGDQIQLFYLRARAFSSGLSPLVPLGVLTGALYFWLWSELKRRRLMVRLTSFCPLESLCDPAITGCAPTLQSLRGLLTRTWPQEISTLLLPVIAFVPPVYYLWWTVQPVAEPRPCGRLFILLLAVAYALSALSFYRFVRLWQGAFRILNRLDNASPEVAEAFEGIAKDLDWKPLKSFGWQIPPFKTLSLSVVKLRGLVAAGRVVVAGYPAALDDPLRAVFENEQDGGSAEEMANRIRIEKIFLKACQDLRDQVDNPAVKQFLAVRVAAYLRYVFAHMRSCLIGALSCGLLALIAVTVYAFEPKHFVSLAAWLALAFAVAATLWIFLQMDRNPTLSRIGGTSVGQVTFDRVFVANLLTYVGIPVLGLVATQFPAVGKLLGSVAGQFLRVVGGG
jgi:hypothetical protein